MPGEITLNFHLRGLLYKGGPKIKSEITGEILVQNGPTFYNMVF